MAMLAALLPAALGGTATSIAPMLMAAGTIASTAGVIQQGDMALDAAKFQAKQLKQAGIGEKASASVDAQEEALKKDLVLSRVRAVSAASGGGVDIPLLGEIEEEGMLRQRTAVWAGNERAAGRQVQADAAMFEGRQIKKASYIKAGTSFASGATRYIEDYVPAAPATLLSRGRSFHEKFG